MKVAIVGSRNFTDYGQLTAAVEDLTITEVISGGAAGADRLAERWAQEQGKHLTVIRAEWECYGRSAGMIRNAEIVKRADMIIALWDGQSPGTRATIGMAKKAGKKLKIVRLD